MSADAFVRPVKMNQKFRVFSLYLDLPASVHARWVATTIARLAGPHWQTSSAMWKIDALRTSERIGQMMTEDAVSADVIILAVSSLAQCEIELQQWLDGLAANQTRQRLPGLLIGLLGDEDTTTTHLDGTVKPLIDCAQKMERDFIWHWMGDQALNDSDWLEEGIQNLLARKAATNEVVAL